jgi:hypothetical protein
MQGRVPCAVHACVSAWRVLAGYLEARHNGGVCAKLVVHIRRTLIELEPAV